MSDTRLRRRFSETLTPSVPTCSLGSAQSLSLFFERNQALTSAWLSARQVPRRTTHAFPPMLHASRLVPSPALRLHSFQLTLASFPLLLCFLISSTHSDPLLQSSLIVSKRHSATCLSSIIFKTLALTVGFLLHSILQYEIPQPHNTAAQSCQVTRMS